MTACLFSSVDRLSISTFCNACIPVGCIQSAAVAVCPGGGVRGVCPGGMFADGNKSFR